MADDFGTVRRNVSFFLYSLKSSVERPIRARQGAITRARGGDLKALLMIEEARIIFNSYVRFREEPSAEDWAEARGELIRFVRSFVSADDFDESISRRPFLSAPLTRADRDQPSDFIKKFYDRDDEGRISFQRLIGESLQIFQEYLESGLLDVATVQGVVAP